jgi:hypothetical protein
VTVDIKPGRTVSQLAGAVGRDARLPSTVVVSASSYPDHTPSRRLQRQIRAVLDVLGSDRTSFWLTNPEPSSDELTGALTRLAPTEPGLQLVTPAKLLEALGLAGDADPTASAVPGCDDGLGGYGSVAVGDCAFVLPKANPRSCQDAMRWALAQVDGPPVWYRRCLNFMARSYGYTVSGVDSAALYWATSVGAHPGDANPPAGALAFWDTGTEDGHVALSLGGGLVASNDVAGRGTIAVLPLADLTNRWSARYLGWAPPFFPHGS